MRRTPGRNALSQVMHVDILVIETGDLLKGLSARVHEVFLTLFANFLNGLKAIRGESGAHHQEALATFIRQSLETFIRIGAQPLFRTKPRLEGEFNLVAAKTRGLTK
jgi:hypothetical protein